MVKFARFADTTKLWYGVRTTSGSQSIFVECEGGDVLELNTRHFASAKAVVRVVEKQERGGHKKQWRKVLFGVNRRLRRVAVLAMVIGTRSIDVEVATDLGAGQDPPFRTFNWLPKQDLCVSTVSLRTGEVTYLSLLEGEKMDTSGIEPDPSRTFLRRC